MLKRWNFLKTGFYEGIKYADVLRKVPFTMALEVGTSAVLALESGEEPKEMVLRSIAAVKTMLGDLAE